MSLPRTLLALVAVVALATGCGSGDDDAAPTAGEALVGLFAVAPGACTDDGVDGSYFRMVQAGGDATAGPFMDNGDSACADKSWSPLAPGTDGGLRTGDHQPQAEPLFQEDGTSTADRVIAPATFFAIGFGISTNPVDPQTGRAVPVPAITADGAALTGDLSAISVSWNHQFFNQGAPKPGDPPPGTLTGTYDPGTGAYALDWTSLIEGGPFDGFTGIWHFEGTFTPA